MPEFFQVILTILSVILIVVYLFTTVRVVAQTNLEVIETLGSYSRTQGSGFYILWWPIQTVAAKLSTKIVSMEEKIVVKTEDSQFVSLPITVLIVIADGFKAHYSLEKPQKAINAMVLNIVRPTASNMSLDELFADRDHLMQEVRAKLSASLTNYGWSLVDLLIDQPALSGEAQHAFNAVLLAQKHKQAAVAEGDAARIKVEAQAAAEAQAQRLRAQGLADSRTILATSLKQSIEDLSGVAPQEAIALLLETNRIDALRTMAKESNNLIILDTDKNVPVIVNRTTHAQ